MYKIKSTWGGINRLTGILLFLIAVMLVVISIPAWKRFEYRAEKTGCQQAMKTAKDGLIIEYLSRYEEDTVEEARELLNLVMPERPNICPTRGTVYLIKGENGIYEPVCGLHEDDIKLRTRLNASRAMELLSGVITKAKENGDPEPMNVEISLNGKSLECVRVMIDEPIYRGTRTTRGYEGVVVFYGVAGDGVYTHTKLSKGEIAYFCYAEEDCIAVWHEKDGWTGLAYE